MNGVMRGGPTLGSMTRWQASSLVILIWAAIYLPGLGSTEIKGEEGRRILPAIEMIRSGDWVVPRLSGEDYLRKPPLINWAIALSIQAAGVQNEWAARLPSALAMLLLGLSFVLFAGRWLRPEIALVGAVFALTQIGLVEKGRLAEIEALYVALTGMAIICWMSWWREERNPWLLWTVPAVFLSLAMLTKGPLHLLFHYAIVIAVLAKSGELRRLLSPAHVFSLAVGAGIFCAWLIPYLGAVESGEVSDTWSGQMVERFTDVEFDAQLWLLSIPRGLSNFLPWVLVTPLLWMRHMEAGMSGRDLALLRGGRLAVVVCFFGLLLVPGFLARYTMPLLIPASLLLVLAMRDGVPAGLLTGWRRGVLVLASIVIIAGAVGPFFSEVGPLGFVGVAGSLLVAGLLWANRERLRSAPALAVASGAVMGAAMFFYAAVAVPRIIEEDDVRPFGPRLDAAIPDGVTLHAVNIDYQPEMFYVRSRVRYFEDWDDVPQDARWLLIRTKALNKARDRAPGVIERESFEMKLDKPLLLLEAPAGVRRK